ncbi:16S rRNA (guanine(966)-N(2))-methyltransferase RsmD [Sporolactobacillus sp. CPB3-1]|uniref:16S rRNA (Guanine(966)-N(2))-methyltransferase RsmD n=1 Tax=Sporolactobacillus mangiferae TaxID=2940498 RepID=A0ABT0M7X5_9BACL|nr:16S rRNA (guanine(966)-N(2))-methyltransferase RsmD [Sporolactobacillus mangiferae]MCL1630961.1 16S rRNA (guanine(966)-N(2))-methyltransferase RsmD [Sporolactobacillus mangiferae]
MRVISGENKGRKLKTVNSRMTRPTTDKVKETIFNMIGPFFDGGMVLDLYGGSGGLGIEALSRGCAFSVFVDRAAAACNIIRENVAACGYKERAKIMKLEAARALEQLSVENREFTLVFIDPPYAKQHILNDLDTLVKRRLLRPNAVVVVEHDEDVQLPDTWEGKLVRKKYRTYQGYTAVSVYHFDDVKE